MGLNKGLSTHFGLICWYNSAINLGYVKVCCLTSPEHYLNHFGLIINGVLWHSPAINFVISNYYLNPQHNLAEYTFEVITIISRGQWTRSYPVCMRVFVYVLPYVARDKNISCNASFMAIWNLKNEIPTGVHRNVFIKCRTILIIIFLHHSTV